MLKKITVDSQFFNAKDTLECGQIFRYFPVEEGYLVLSGEKACILTSEKDKTVVLCNDEDEGYFYNYFDLKTDYKSIFQRAQTSNYEILKNASSLGKGVRILRQDREEMLFSFLISQNNNIPRIKKAVNSLAEKLGNKKSFNGHDYYTFPTAKKLNLQTEEFFKEVGLGYRSSYMKTVSEWVNSGQMQGLENLSREEVKQALMQIKGVGEKVADCVCLFGFSFTESFPVDVWIEKIYREDFCGNLTNRSKITEFFLNEFKGDAGYFQQYLFYYKRSLENKNKG